MAVTAQRRLVTQNIRSFGSGRESFDLPDLTQIQTESYERAFLQYNGGSPAKRKNEGPRSGPAGNLPDRELRQDDQARVSCATSSASRATAWTSAGSYG